jgi:citrate lyase subunit beta/citryl-CoA lyase
VILPKVQEPADVVEVDNLLTHFERRQGMEIGQIHIVPSLESAQGIRQAYEIAMASPRVAHMGCGGGKEGDTARSIGYQWTPEGLETLFIRSKVLVDVRAAGILYPLTGGWMDIRDLTGLRAFAQQFKRLGFTGLVLIHPSQVQIANEVFTPTADEVKQWQGLIETMEERRTQGGAAVNYHGDMVDIAHEETARTMLALAREFGAPGT